MRKLKQIPYKKEAGGAVREVAGWEGSEQSHPPTNNLIFSLSTAKCARTPDARLPEMRVR